MLHCHRLTLQWFARLYLDFNRASHCDVYRWQWRPPMTIVYHPERALEGKNWDIIINFAITKRSLFIWPFQPIFVWTDWPANQPFGGCTYCYGMKKSKMSRTNMSVTQTQSPKSILPSHEETILSQMLCSPCKPIQVPEVNVSVTKPMIPVRLSLNASLT